MTSYFSVLKRVWWRSSLLSGCIVLVSILYMTSESKYLSEGKFSESFFTSASSKLNEQIKTLQEKVDILQKRYVWLELHALLVIV